MINRFLTTIEQALQQSRKTIKRYYRQRIIVESKADAKFAKLSANVTPIMGLLAKNTAPSKI